jgi:tricorn protease
MRRGKDCLLWYRCRSAGARRRPRGTDEQAEQPVLERYDLGRRKLDVIADPVSCYAVSGDGTRLLVAATADRCGCCAPTGPARARPTSGDAPTSSTIDTRRIVVTVDPTAEWRQMFDEAGRLMRDHFWVADMAGVDWAAELARYRPLVDAVGSHDDLVDLLWELQGELGTSHAYVRGGGRRLDGRPGPARRRPGARRRRLAGGAGAAAGDVGAGRAQPAVRPGRRRAGRRRDPGGRRAGRSTRRRARRRCWSAPRTSWSS